MAYNAFLIMNLMRILTPEEINELTTRYCGEKRVSLTSLMNTGEELAKILPFKSITNGQADVTEKLEETVPVHIKLFCGENVNKLFYGLYGIKSSSMTSLVQSEQQHQEVVIKQKKSASIFILEQKEKLDYNQRKLKSSEILKSYKKVSAVDLEVERGHQDDLSWSSSQGLLVNKKQA